MAPLIDLHYSGANTAARQRMIAPIPPESADITAWRGDQRKRLIALRESIAPGQLLEWRVAIDSHLRRGFPGLRGSIVAICWPYRNEYDARHLAAQLRSAGTTILLPVVVAKAAPLQFREWHPGTVMARGTLGIPYPTESPFRQPKVVLLPMVGFDSAGYRLGYGGGYFDRTLAAAQPRPVVIGVVNELARMETIHPQEYDIPADYVVTERGVYRRDGNELAFLGTPMERDSPGVPLSSPVCYANSPEVRRNAGD